MLTEVSCLYLNLPNRTKSETQIKSCCCKIRIRVLYICSIFIEEELSAFWTDDWVLQLMENQTLQNGGHVFGYLGSLMNGMGQWYLTDHPKQGWWADGQTGLLSLRVHSK